MAGKGTEIEKFVPSPNDKQKANVNLSLPDEKNGECLLPVFGIVPEKRLSLIQAATKVAAELSTETPFSREMNALVLIACTLRLFDRRGNMQKILTYVVGKILGMKDVSELKLLDIQFSPSMVEKYDGQSYALDDLREYLRVFDKQTIWTIVKQKNGLTSAKYAEVCYAFLVLEVDFVKNNEPRADNYFCQYDKIVLNVKEAIDKAVKETGKKNVRLFSVSAPDYDTIVARCEITRSAGFRPGSYCFLIGRITAGWMAVLALGRKYPGIFPHFHREMKGSPEEEVSAAQNILHFKGKNHLFEQGLGMIPENDEDSARHLILKDDRLSGMKKCCPIISGGLKPLIDIVGLVDFITTIGAGYRAHPKWTKVWARALVQAREEYSKGRPELAEEMEFVSSRKRPSSDEF